MLNLVTCENQANFGRRRYGAELLERDAKHLSGPGLLSSRLLGKWRNPDGSLIRAAIEAMSLACKPQRVARELARLRTTPRGLRTQDAAGRAQD